MERNLKNVKEVTSSLSLPHEFLRVLRPEADEEISRGQREVEAQLMARVTHTRPSSNKISLDDEPLEPVPRIQAQVPKPKPHEEQEEVKPDYVSALDKLGKLDNKHKDKNFGLYSRGFRSTHASALDFFKYRKANPVGHPNAPVDIDEDALMETYCNLYFEKPTADEFFYEKTVTYGCDDRRLKMANDA